MIGQTIQRDLPPAAKAVEGTRVPVTVEDTGVSKTLEYVKEGSHWVLRGCRAVNHSQANCTEPGDAPHTTDG